jgi:flagellar basal-body rod protein FlgB
MGIDLLDRSIAALSRGLVYATRRHEVITENLAHAATPHYRARDLVFDDALARAARTAPGDVGPALAVSAPGQPRARLVYADDGAPGPDGNDVHGERQAARLAENLLYHSTLVATLSNRLTAVKQAISGRV